MLNQKYYKLLNIKNNPNLKLLKSNFYRDLAMNIYGLRRNIDTKTAH